MNTHQERLDNANALILVIATCGRRFFNHQGRVAYLERDRRGRIWFHDAYTLARIYTHYRYDWRGFTNGGTLRSLIERLRDYVVYNKPLSGQLGPWPDWYCNGDLWGYGDDMQKVRDVAARLGITAEVKP